MCGSLCRGYRCVEATGDGACRPRGAASRAARAARLAAGAAAATHYSKGYLSNLEHGNKPANEDVARVCDEALGAGGDLIAAAHLDTAAARYATPWQTAELLGRLRASDTAPGTLEVLHATVSGLCCQYPYRDVLTAADAGRAVDSEHTVYVQLIAQGAKARARLGDIEGVTRDLEHGREFLTELPRPERTDHHFVVDPDKWIFYAMELQRRYPREAATVDFRDALRALHEE